VRRFLPWAIFALIVVIAPFVLEVLTRLIVPQNLSNSWLVRGPLGQTINQANGTARHQHGQRVVYYRFNSFHQRGPEPSPETRKILILGDSYTFGWLLEEDKTYPRLLQMKLDKEFGQGKFEILVGATGGWGMSDLLIYLESIGERIKPELVVSIIENGDIHTANARGIYRFEDEYGFELSTTDMWEAYPKIPLLVRRLPGYQWLLRHSHLMQLFRIGISSLQLWPTHMFMGRFLTEGVEDFLTKHRENSEQLSKGLSAEIERNFRRFGRAFFRRMKQWTESKDIELLVLTKGWPNDGLSVLSKAWVGELMAKEGIRFFDLTSQVTGAVLKDPAGYKIPGEGHPNERGAALIAEAAWPHLKATVERLTAK